MRSALSPLSARQVKRHMLWKRVRRVPAVANRHVTADADKCRQLLLDMCEDVSNTHINPVSDVPSWQLTVSEFSDSADNSGASVFFRRDGFEYIRPDKKHLLRYFMKTFPS